MENHKLCGLYVTNIIFFIFLSHQEQVPPAPTALSSPLKKIEV